MICPVGDKKRRMEDSAADAASNKLEDTLRRLPLFQKRF